MVKDFFTKERRLTFGEFLFLVFVIAFIWLFVDRYEEIRNIAQILLSGKWMFIIGAAIFEFGYYWSYCVLYKYSYDVVGIKSRVRHLLPVMFASVFANLAPSGGTSGAALFIHDAVSRKESMAKATVGYLLVQLFDFIAFLFILGFGIAYLLTQHDLKSYQAIASSILILAIGIVCTLLALSAWQISLIQRLLSVVQNIINKFSRLFVHKNILGQGWHDRTSMEFQEAAIAISRNPRKVLKAFGAAYLTYIIKLGIFLFLFLAFGQEIRLGVLVTGYSMTHLLSTITITPHGLGVVEGLMTVIYASLGMPAEKAAVITLSYRGLNLYLPILVGFILLRKLRLFNGKK